MLGRIAATHAAETAATVTRTANTLAGGSSIYSTSSLLRHARDAEAVTHHFTVAQHTWEEAGRVLFGPRGDRARLLNSQRGRAPERLSPTSMSICRKKTYTDDRIGPSIRNANATAVHLSLTPRSNAH